MNDSGRKDFFALVSDCEEQLCPLYTAFFDRPNAQSIYRVDHLKWSMKYKPAIFSAGGQKFGAKLALLMESPPPDYLEYFYGPDGGFQKEKGLFASVMKLLLSVEGAPSGFKDLDPEDQRELVNNKEYWLRWAGELGVVVVDAAKCRLKISDVLKTDKVTPSQIDRAFQSCGDILKAHLLHLNPFRIAIGIASVYDSKRHGHPLIAELLREIEIEDRLINKRTTSIWDRGKQEFHVWFPEVWKQTKNEYDQFKQKS